jgi:hypothetical protein
MPDPWQNYDFWKLTPPDEDRAVFVEDPEPDLEDEERILYDRENP